MDNREKASSQLRFVKDYKSNETLRLSFNQLAIDTFGIDFEPWYQKGFWTDDYICYSYAADDRVVANVSVNQMSLVWDGQEYCALQIGTVMTDPEFQKKGLSYKLLDTVIKEWDDKVDFIYLFGNDLALNMYMKFDMKPFEEHRYSAKLPIGSKDKQVEGLDYNIRKLDLSKDEDLEFMVEMARKRVSQSDAIGIHKDLHLMMFYCYKFYSNNVYYIEDKDAIVVMEEDNGVLHLYDVISEKIQSIDELVSLLPHESSSKIEFHFKPCDCDLDVEEALLNVDDRTLLIRHKGLEPKQKFRFSSFSHA